MGAIPVVRKTGPYTFTPADNATVRAGNLVEAAASGRIAVAQAASETVLGVALQDAVAPEDLDLDGDSSGARYLLNVSPLPTLVPVAGMGDIVPVVYAADATFGALLKAAATGTVTPWLKASDKPETIVGRCFQPGGVDQSVQPVGLMRVGY